MNQYWLNNWRTQLDAGIDAETTTIPVPSTEAAKLMALGLGGFYLLTIIQGAKVEIVKCTARSGGNLTCARGQDGTTGQVYTAGATIDIRNPAYTYERGILDRILTADGEVLVDPNGNVATI
jgi:hypothetical protein